MSSSSISYKPQEEEANSTEAEGKVISRVTASIYRKALATNKTVVRMGQGKPRIVKILTLAQRDFREQPLQAYDAKRSVYASKWSKQLNTFQSTAADIQKDTKDLKECQERMQGDTEGILGLLKGKEIECDPEPSDKERTKDIRLFKRQLDNEVGDIKEREVKRLATANIERPTSTQSLAALAEASIGHVAELIPIDTRKSLAEQKAELATLHRAQMKTLAVNHKQEQQANTKRLRRRQPRQRVRERRRLKVRQRPRQKARQPQSVVGRRRVRRRARRRAIFVSRCRR